MGAIVYGDDAVAEALQELGARYLGRPLDQVLLIQLEQEIEAKIPGAKAVATFTHAPNDICAYVRLGVEYYQLDITVDGSVLC
jgi:hypothetical protein